MKVSKNWLFLSVLGLGLAGCSEESWLGPDGEGGISLKLEASADVKDAVPVLRSGAPALEAPDAANFAVSLENLSTGEVQTWNTLNDFNSQKSFKTGSYTLTAYYGSLKEEGFDKPYFTGSTNLSVLEARNTDAAVVATLANSMVSIEYTDAFRNYFRAYKANLHSAGGSYIEFAPEELRPAFVAPGEVSLAIDVTNPSGKSVTLQPAAFPALAQHHYHITLDVKQIPSGDNQLQIVFDESLETENVSIDLTDELFTSPAPSVAPIGFANGQMLEALEGNPLQDPVRFDVIARGGIVSAILTLNGDNLTPAFGNEIDLVKASVAEQAQLADLGIKVIGLYKNPQAMAYVDLSGFAAKLPSGKSSASLVVKDAFTRVSDPMTVNFTNVPVVVEAADATAVAGNQDTVIEVAYNGADPEKNISFKAMSKSGVYKDCVITNVQESTRTRAFETKNYLFSIVLPDTDHDPIPVKVYFSGVEKMQVNVSVIRPEYSVETDAFSKYAKLRVSTPVASDLAVVTNSLKIYKNGSALTESDLRRDNESGMITVLGLSPATNYTFGDGLIGDTPEHTYSVATETEANVPNGDFAQTAEYIHIDKLNSGGKYKAGVKGECYNTETMNISQPTGWANLNTLTCYSGSANHNTWFMVPSTMAENGTAVIRSVAYDHNGTDPEYKNWGTFNYTYYNPNLPASIGSKASGELFLGSYSFNGSASRTDGVGFSSRPQSLAFDYAYSPVGGETGYVQIQLLDASGSVIASGSADLTSAGSMTRKEIALGNYPFGKKAATLRISFKSTKGADIHTNMPGSGNIDGVSGVPGAGGGHKLGTNASKSRSLGSVLTIDNVSLNY